MSKDNAIETLRGIAILLVVGLHITNDGPIAPAQAFYDYLAYSFQNIRIPLFTMISGYLYGLRPVTPGAYQTFVKGKARRILLPLIFVASLEYLAKALLPGVNKPEPLSEFWKAVVYPYEHYWFLQVIFIIFLFVGILGHLRVLPSFRNWAILGALSISLYLIYPSIGLGLTFFSLGATTYLMPFFLLGYGIASHGDRVLRPISLPNLWIIVFALAFGFQQFTWFFGDPLEAGKRTVVGLLVSLSAGALFIRFRRPVWGIATIGSFAYAIYLYQGFGTSLGRRVLAIVPDIGPHTYFAAMLLIAVCGGIVAEIVLKRIPYLRTALLGVKSRR